MPRIVLWNPPARRSAYRLMDWDGNVLEEGPMLTADEVYCDLCNADVIIRRVSTRLSRTGKNRFTRW